MRSISLGLSVFIDGGGCMGMGAIGSESAGARSKVAAVTTGLTF